MLNAERLERNARKAGLGWNDERIALLKKLWSEGLSASQIAGRLGSVTRNAVIGKVHRLGLSGRVDPYKRVPRARRVDHKPKARTRVTSLSLMKKVLAVIDPLPDPDAPLPGAKLVSLVDLDDRGACRFPHGDGPFTFCGCKAVPGLSYCKDHARLAYPPPQPTINRRPLGLPRVLRDRIIDRVEA